MPLTTQDLLARLAELGIETTTVEHPPLFTVEDSQNLRGDIPGGHTKNLFLKDKKGNIFLVVVEEETRVDLKSLHQPLGAASRLSFGPVNDTEGRVTVVLDAELMTHETVNCHPLVNTATTAIRSADLIRFLRTTGHEPLVMAVPRRTDAAEEG